MTGEWDFCKEKISCAWNVDRHQLSHPSHLRCIHSVSLATHITLNIPYTSEYLGQDWDLTSPTYPWQKTPLTSPSLLVHGNCWCPGIYFAALNPFSKWLKWWGFSVRIQKPQKDGENPGKIKKGGKILEFQRSVTGKTTDTGCKEKKGDGMKTLSNSRVNILRPSCLRRPPLFSGVRDWTQAVWELTCIVISHFLWK